MDLTQPIPHRQVVPATPIDLKGVRTANEIGDSLREHYPKGAEQVLTFLRVPNRRFLHPREYVCRMFRRATEAAPNWARRDYYLDRASERLEIVANKLTSKDWDAVQVAAYGSGVDVSDYRRRYERMPRSARI